MSWTRSRGWRRLAGLGALLLALGLAASGLLAEAATSTGPWTVLKSLPVPASRHLEVWKVVGDPASPQDLAAATNQGVFTSADDGQSWSESDLHQFTWTLAYGSGGNALYAGTAYKGVFRSTDAGQTWHREDTGLRSLDVRAIATGPTAIVLGTEGGVYVSGNGEAWEQAGLSGTSISAVAIVANTPLGVMAGSDQTAQKANLFLALAVGASSGWQQLTGGDPGGAPVFAIAAGPVLKGSSTPPVLVGNLKGLYATPDAGSTWHALSLAGGPQWSADAIAFDPNNPQVIYVGGDNGGSSGGGLQRSVDGGGSFAAFQQGLPSHDQDVTGLSALSTTPLTVLAATWNPISREGGTARALDSSAPGPVALNSSGGTPIKVAVSPTASAAPHHHQHHRQKSKSSSIPVGLVAGIVVVLIILIILFSVYMRRRRRRLDAEAPP